MQILQNSGLNKILVRVSWVDRRALFLEFALVLSFAKALALSIGQRFMTTGTTDANFIQRRLPIGG
jgi:hypothetical protein